MAISFLNNYVPDINRIAYREMAEVSIAKSYLGILRISNVLEAEKEDDYYFNPVYYGTPTGGISNEETGYDTAYNAMTGALVRYAWEGDPYRNNKVPVTDSAGNFMNFWVGENSVTFGSDELNNGNSSDQATYTQVLYNKQFKQQKIFPILKSDKIIIGLQERVLPESKNTIDGGHVQVDASPYHESVDAKIIVNSNFDHTPGNLTDNGKTYLNLSEKDAAHKYRTVYQDTNPTLRDYDAFVHFQDNYDDANYKTNNVVDSVVDVINLKSYVRDKLQKYIDSNNITEVPTGTILWEYVSLAKWFCLGDNSWSGNYPPMGILNDDKTYTPTLYQGVVRKGLNRLAAMSDEIPSDDVGVSDTSGSDDEFETKQLKEMIPLYKRDYTLCDGSTFYIYMTLPELANDYNYISYDQFINLFFAIGYQYTDLETIRVHYENEVVRTVGDTQVYGWTNPDNRVVSTECNDKDVLFTLDLLQMITFKVIYNELKTGSSVDGHSACLGGENFTEYDRTNAENWLKTQEIPKEFLFNTMIPYKDKNGVKQGGMKFVFQDTTTEAKKIYEFDIGCEVNSYSSLLWYYDSTAKTYKKVPVWATAEVQGVLDFFAQPPVIKERWLKTYYFFRFQVPNFIQKTDAYETGTFLGYSPLTWGTDFNDVTGFASTSTYSNMSHPHRHAIAMGPEVFYPAYDQAWEKNNKGEYAYPYIETSTGAVTGNEMCRSEGMLRYNHFWAGNSISIPGYSGLANGYAAEESPGSPWPHYPCRREASENIEAYALAELPNAYYNQEVHDGVAQFVVQCRGITDPNDPDPRWRNAEPNRGITSEAVTEDEIDEKKETASGNTAEGEIKYYTPEYTQMVPLIKL